MTGLPGQTKLGSLVEAWANTFSGMLVSVLASVWVIMPAHGIEISLWSNISITLWFTLLSIVRSYLWRRYFNHRYLKRLE